ncbi:response regulator transcription factor [Actinoplanes sp. NPDC026623]|uniref:response regulator transcription factor n=1 Tax=Actinoplanes sp. NPDC026623 TaxID=3155610 RepID=UPI0033CA67E9
MMRIALVADVRLYCEGLAAVLATVDGIDVVGHCRRWQEAVPMVARTHPDVVLIDAPPSEKRAAVRHLTADGTAAVRVVALSVEGVERDLIEWAEAGISGFVTRDNSVADLIGIVRSVANHEMPCSPRIAAMLLHRVGVLAAGRTEPECRLTARERQILVLIERGLSNKEIARHLSIQLPTVKNHVHNVLEKLRVSRREDAVAVARGATAAARGPR